MAKLKAGSTVDGKSIATEDMLSNIDKSNVGLGNVDNVKQASKSEFDSHKNDTGNPHGVTKSQVGLSNVDNKSLADIRTDNSELRTEVVSSLPQNAVDGQIILLTEDDGDIEKGYHAYFDGEWV